MVRQELMLPKKIMEAIEVFASLADVHRQQIVGLVGRNGPMCVGDIARNFLMSRPAVSHHLKVLKRAGLLTAHRQGKEIHYEFNRERTVQVLRWMADAVEQQMEVRQTQAK
ncbi:MAG: metalloregulator ArsR/SmtB family transcription factor [Bacillota bacterium]